MNTFQNNKYILWLIVGLVVLLVIIGGLVSYFSSPRDPQAAEAERVIFQYIENENLSIRKGTNEYKTFLRDILLGEHPSLSSGENSELIQAYIVKYLQFEPDN